METRQSERLFAGCGGIRRRKLQFGSVRGGTVPSYLFHCRNCLMKPFTKQLSLHDYDVGGIVCPFCGGNDVEQQLSLLFPVTSKKSA